MKLARFSETLGLIILRIEFLSSLSYVQERVCCNIFIQFFAQDYIKSEVPQQKTKSHERLILKRVGHDSLHYFHCENAGFLHVNSWFVSHPHLSAFCVHFLALNSRSQKNKSP